MKIVMRFIITSPASVRAYNSCILPLLHPPRQAALHPICLTWWLSGSKKTRHFYRAGWGPLLAKSPAPRSQPSWSKFLVCSHSFIHSFIIQAVPQPHHIRGSWPDRSGRANSASCSVKHESICCSFSICRSFPWVQSGRLTTQRNTA